MVRKRIGKVEFQIRTYACMFFSQIYFTCVSNDIGEAKYLTLYPSRLISNRLAVTVKFWRLKKMLLEGLSKRVLHKLLGLFLICSFATF